MLVPHRQPEIKVIRSAPGEDRAAWAQAIRTFDTGTAQVLKSDGDTAVYRATLLGRDVVLKRWSLSTRGARAKATLSASRGHRHWRAAARLEHLRLRTARCLALALEQRDPPRVWLAMEFLPGPTVLECMADPGLDIRDQHAIARSLGAQVGAFRLAGIHNRDHKPSNLILVDHSPDSLAVIDCLGIRRGQDPERMLASLLIEPTGCGVPVRAPLAMRALVSFLGARSRGQNRAGWREHRNLTWAAVRAEVTAHGDPTPRINPLVSTNS